MKNEALEELESLGTRSLVAKLRKVGRREGQCPVEAYTGLHVDKCLGVWEAWVPGGTVWRLGPRLCSFLDRYEKGEFEGRL